MGNGEIGKLNESQDDGEELDSRREALKKMGKYAAYTAPALIAVLTAGKALGDDESSGDELYTSDGDYDKDKE